MGFIQETGVRVLVLGLRSTRSRTKDIILGSIKLFRDNIAVSILITSVPPLGTIQSWIPAFIQGIVFVDLIMFLDLFWSLIFFMAPYDWIERKKEEKLNCVYNHCDYLRLLYLDLKSYYLSIMEQEAKLGLFSENI